MFERFDPVIDNIHKDPKAFEQFNTWRESRADFMKRLAALENEAVEEKWQKTYYRGLRPDGSPGARDHKIKLRVKPFRKVEK